MVPELMPVVGVRLVEGRSGSTLLMQLLATSHEIVFDSRYPAEYRWLSYFARMAQRMTEPFDAASHPGVTEFFFGAEPVWGPVPFRSDVVDVGQLSAPVLRGFWRAWSAAAFGRHPAARYYAEKLAVRVDVVTDAGIPLRVIDLVRDPRDMLASIRGFTRNGTPGFGWVVGMSDLDYLDHFVDAVRVGLERIGESSVDPGRLLVRYEDLVTDLAAEAERIGGWLGTELRAGDVLAQRDAYRHHMTASTPAGSIGRWRTDLTTAEADRLSRELGPLAARVGYSL